jgi:O-antigen ligase/ABC-type amino acid transport substrate-binding protein
LAHGLVGVGVAALGATVVAAIVAALAVWRSLGAGLAVLAVSQIAANGSLTRAKDAALAARWAPLLVVAAALLPELRHLRPVARRVVPLAALPAFALVSAAWSFDTRLSIERTVSFGLLLWVAAAAAIRWRRDRRAFDGLADAFAVVAGVVVVASAAMRVVDPTRALLNGQWRGVFENPNGLGLFVSLTYPFAAAALERRGLGKLQIAVLAVFAVVDGLSQSRSGVLALVVGALGYEVARRRGLRLVLYAAAGLAALVALVAAAGPLGSAATVTKSGGVLSAPGPEILQAPGTPVRQSFAGRVTGARNEAWSATTGLIASRPILGYGFGTGDRLFARYPERVHFEYFVGDNPNEAYLQLVLELGVVGALLFLAPLLAGATLGIRFLRRGCDPNRAAVVLVLLATLLTGLVESVFTSAGAPWETLLWVSALAVLTAPHEAQVAHSKPWEAIGLGLPTGRQVVLGAGALAVASVAAALYFALRPGPSRPPRLAEIVRRLADTSECDHTRCRVAETKQIEQGYWWIRVVGRRSVCFVAAVHAVRLERGKSPLALSGIAGSTCRPLPLRTPHALTVATLPTRPPYLAPPASAPTGFEPAVIRILARHLGIGLVRWTSTSRAAPSGPVDFVTHDLRPAWALPRGFVPYLSFEDSLIVRRGTPAVRISTLAQARLLRIAQTPNSSAAVAHLLRPSRPARTYPSDDAALAALRRGDVDAVVVLRIDGIAYMRADRTLTSPGILAPDRFYGFRFSPGSRLERLIVAGLRRLRRDGVLAKLRVEELGALPPARRLR